MFHRREVREQPAGQHADAFVDHVIADGLEVFESDLYSGGVEVIERANLERGGTFGAVDGFPSVVFLKMLSAFPSLDFMMSFLSFG